MAGSLADRATRDVLIGPDWAMNVGICDILNHEPGQAKDVAKVLRRRIGSKNAKVQLLSLTLLETVVQNCGDIVHMHIAERNIPHKMVKIAKKKSDIQVKEKILVLIDTWQEALGGASARHPQYFAAYQDLLRAGVPFPRRPERSAPVFSPQSWPATSNSRADKISDNQTEECDVSFPTLSLEDLQNIRGVMDVLAEMLNALDTGKGEDHKQEVIVDLVQQCRVYKRRVVLLVNSTSEEELLCQGIALNDDLQRLLDKHGAISEGLPTQTEEPKALQPLIDIDDGTVANQDSNTQADKSSPPQQSLLPAPPASNGVPASAGEDSLIDLLSGENTNVPDPSTDPLALVSVNGPHQDGPASSAHTMLALPDMLNGSNGGINIGGEPHSAFPNLHSYTAESPFQPLPQQHPPHPFHPDTGNIEASHVSQPGYVEGVHWGHTTQQPWTEAAQGPIPQHQAFDHSEGNHDGSFPPPPWETEAPNFGQQDPSANVPRQGDLHLGSMPMAMEGNQPLGAYPPFMPNGGHAVAAGGFPHLQNGGTAAAAGYPDMVRVNGFASAAGPYPQIPNHGQPGGPYSHHVMQGAYMVAGYYPLNGEDMNRRMYQLSMQEPMRPPQAMVSASYAQPPPMRQSKPEDRLFGDLVSFAKAKPPSNG